MRDVYVIKVVWTNGLGPTIGPIVGITNTRKLCTLIRKRLRANNHPFVRVEYTLLHSTDWFFGLDFMLDPVDRLLASIREGAWPVLESLT